MPIEETNAVRPDLGEFSPIDLVHIPELIKRGRQAAEQVVPSMLRDLKVESEIAG